MEFDHIVVGGGIEGTATAYSLAKRGKRTLLLEKFPLPHTRGSSHGASRIIRKAYEKPIYTKMMIESYKLWEALEKESGQVLVKKSGLLTYAPKRSGKVQHQADIMQEQNLPFTVLLEMSLQKQFGRQLKVDSDTIGLVDPDGGVLCADKCLIAFRKEFQALGGTVVDGEEVVSVMPGSSVWVVTSSGKKYCGKSVVLCLGAWAGPFLSSVLGLSLPLRPELIKVCYFKSSDPKAFSVQAGFPCIISYPPNTDNHFYGLPADEYPGMFKFCLHRGPAIDPDKRDAADDSEALAVVQDYVRRHMPLLDPKPAIVENCIYTWTPDANFVLDYHPRFSNIVLGVGFSGHGFKLAPIVGEVLANFATREPQKYDLQMFKADRFQTASSKL